MGTKRFDPPIELADLAFECPLTFESSEAQLHDYVVELARDLGWVVLWAWPPYVSPTGFPDLTMLRDDRLLFVELKSTRGALKHSQAETLNSLDEFGKAEV